jgi:hypothetical protein
MLIGETQEAQMEFRSLDYSTEIDVLLAGIREILREGSSHNRDIFDRNYWEWAYRRLPTGTSYIYVCICNGDIVGYYHVPIYQGIVDGEPKLFAMVQDVAVSSKMRGRGVFRKLAEFATADLVERSGIDLIYTFPNAKSIHTFTKYNGYKQVCEYDSFILPASSAAVIRSKFRFLGLENVAGFIADKYFDFRAMSLPPGLQVVNRTSFDDETVSLFAAYGSNYPCHLDRSERYLNWRYFEKPAGEHFLFTLDDNGKPTAAAVCKLDEILGAKAAIVLDIAFNEQTLFGSLLHYLRRNSASLFNEKVDMFYVSFGSTDLFSKHRFGMVKVPSRLNPRPLYLLTRNVTADKDVIFEPSSWLALLGDWDVL